jgi:hypothetical protein
VKRHESPWHFLTVTTVRVLGKGEPHDELDYDTGHPDDCDQLRYGETCWFDGEFFEYGQEPTEPGEYRARVWSEGPDYAGEWDGGAEWELLPADEVSS